MDAKHLRATALAPGTTRNLKTQIRTYLTFCIYAGLQYLPIGQQDIIRYITFLSNSFRSWTTVLNYLNGVRFYHAQHGYTFTHMSDHHVALTLRGVKKRLSSIPHQTLPITPHILHSIHNQLNLSDTSHLSFWAACLTAFFGFLRKSNVVPPSRSTFHPSCHLSRSSFAFRPDGSILLTINWSKTIQFHQRSLSIPFNPIPGSPLCPVTALTRMFKAVPAPPSSPAFLVQTPRGLASLTHTSFVSFLRLYLHSIGLDSTSYTGHSFRRGACGYASDLGISPDLLKTFGDWRSNSFERYLSAPLTRRTTVSRSLASHISATSFPS